MKTKSLLLLVVAGACGLVAAFAAAQHIAGNQSEAPAGPVEERKAVVVATADLEAGATIKAENLRVVQLPTKDLPEGTFTAPAEITGQALRFPVFKGEPVLNAKLGRGLQFLANELPEGMKACTMRIPDEENRMKGLINPGNHVDVYFSPMKPDLSTSSVILLLQNIKVLAVGERIEGDDSELHESKLSKSFSTENYTLLVTPLQNKRIVAATYKGGKFRLVLRGKGDLSQESLDEARIDRFLGLNDPVESSVASSKYEPEPEAERWEVDYLKGPDQSKDIVDISEGRRSSAKQ
jgi:pilus assembly protein CpaB